MKSQKLFSGIIATVLFFSFSGAAFAQTLKISGTPSTSAYVGVDYSFKPAVTNTTGKTVSFRVSNKPNWMSFNTSTGALTGKATTANYGGFYNIIIEAVAGTTTARLNGYDLYVKDAPKSTTTAPAPTNTAPVISGSPAISVTAGSAYSFRPSASDANGDALSFSVSNKPSWASFSLSTGQLSGTPSAANVGTTSNVVITVTDAKGAKASLAAFSIAVKAAAVVNVAPVIGGTPQLQLNAGSAYSFMPSASDANGDALTFSIGNKPSWANFNASTGQLSGTPTAGTYSSISISVSDGKGGSASLQAFTIVVAALPTTNGTALLRWTPPTTNDDGSALTNLSGYRVSYGTTAGGPYDKTVDLANASLNSYMVENLTAGTYYFVVTARTSAGVESKFSSQVSKRIN